MCARRVAATHTDDMRAWLAAAAALALLVATARSTDSEVESEDDGCSGLITIKVRFPSGVEASLGNELTPTQVKDQPSVSYPADNDELYTLIFLGRIYGDGDYPSLEAQTGDKIFLDPEDCDDTQPEYREYLHWLIYNIPGDQLSQGEELAQYISSAPRTGTGLHRYTFYLYKQTRELKFDEQKLNNTSIKGRDKFCIEDLAVKYALGAPVGGNYYVAKYDDYVPTVYKNLNAEYVLNLTQY